MPNGRRLGPATLCLITVEPESRYGIQVEYVSDTVLNLETTTTVTTGEETEEGEILSGYYSDS